MIILIQTNSSKRNVKRVSIIEGKFSKLCSRSVISREEQIFLIQWYISRFNGGKFSKLILNFQRKIVIFNIFFNIYIYSSNVRCTFLDSMSKKENFQSWITINFQRRAVIFLIHVIIPFLTNPKKKISTKENFQN